MSLPTYEEATARPEPWLIICPYLPRNALASLCLVSKRFYDVFNQMLWFEPTSLLLKKPYPFLEYDNFARKVWKVRRHVRSLVIGLDFRDLGPVDFLVRNLPGHEGNLMFEWFGSLGRCFPSLKFFLVNGIGDVNPLVQLSRERDAALLSRAIDTRDRAANLGLSLDGVVEDQLSVTTASPERGDSILSESAFRPVLLSARGCGQLFIPMFISTEESVSNLLFLDISWTKQKPRDLAILSFPSQLKVLKMKGLGLTTRDVSSLLPMLKLRLFSLDLSFNCLTNDVVPMLLTHNFFPPFEHPPGTRSRIAQEQNLQFRDRYFEDAPAYSERTDPSEEQETAVVGLRVDLRADDADGVLCELLRDEQARLLTGPNWVPPSGHIFMQPTGLTHLYLDNNRLTSQALKVLLQGTNRLQLLDFGSVPQHRQHLKSKYPHILALSQPDTLNFLKLAVSQRLESLRVHHSVVTTVPTLLSLGDFYLSESRAVYLSEFEYAEKDVADWPPADFIPEINPRIKSLTLTSVPRKSFGLVINRLLRLLSFAGLQETIISHLSPAHTRRSARMLSGLRHLCLEFAPACNIRKKSTSGPSVSGDADADKFMAESMKDFSFFDESTQSPESASEKDFSFFNEKLSEGTPWIPSEEASKKQDPENLELRDVKETIIQFLQRTKTENKVEGDADAGGDVSGFRLPGRPRQHHWRGRVELVDESFRTASECKFWYEVSQKQHHIV